MDLGDLQHQSMGSVCLSELVSRFPSIGPPGKGKREMSFTGMSADLEPCEPQEAGRGLTIRPGQLLRGQVQRDKSQGAWGDSVRTASPRATGLNLASEKSTPCPSICVK
jgi:hypothetical protein